MVSRWPPHRILFAVGALALAAAGAFATGAHWRAVGLLVLAGLLVLVAGMALRPAGPTPTAAEPTWFPASTQFAGSALAPDTALPPEAAPDGVQRPTCARCGSPMVERSGSRGHRPRWICADAPRCGYTLDGPDAAER